MYYCRAFLIILVAIPLAVCNYGWNSSFLNHDSWEGRRNVSHNLILGRREYGDRLLHHNFVNIHRRMFQKLQHNISYPAHGTSPFRITSIRVIDMKTDGTGGYPSLRKGGIGYYHTTINFASQRSHGLHFNVSIFGR